MPKTLELAEQISVFTFVVLSLLSAGLGLSVQEVREPFKSTRLVILALVANFVLVPFSAYLITRAMPVEPSLAIALLLLGTAGGAPMLPKLVEFARGNLALAVGLMALLMLGTIVTMPFVLPMLLPGAHANAWSIARPLLFVVLPSLAIGLGLRAYRAAIAARLQPIFRSGSNWALGIVFFLTIATYFSRTAGVGNGTLHAVIAGSVFILVSFGIGLMLGGPREDTRAVLGLATCQRSVSVAFLVAVENFRDADVVTFLAILSLLALVLQIPGAIGLGKRARSGARAT